MRNFFVTKGLNSITVQYIMLFIWGIQLCVCIEAFLFNFTNTNFMMNIIFKVI